jgi:hypothetical protein
MPSYRETPQQYARRLRRDRIVGVTALVLTLLVLVLNYIMEYAPDLRLLPGGHSELYFIAGIAMASWSAWVAFDLGASRRKRR